MNAMVDAHTWTGGMVDGYGYWGGIVTVTGHYFITGATPGEVEEKSWSISLVMSFDGVLADSVTDETLAGFENKEQDGVQTFMNPQFEIGGEAAITYGNGG